MARAPRSKTKRITHEPTRRRVLEHKKSILFKELEDFTDKYGRTACLVLFDPVTNKWDVWPSHEEAHLLIEITMLEKQLEELRKKNRAIETDPVEGTGGNKGKEVLAEPKGGDCVARDDTAVEDGASYEN